MEETKKYYKLLVAYDISEQPITESVERDAIVEILESQPEWVHLQRSVWIIKTKITYTDIMQTLLSKLNQDTQNLMSVVDISSRDLLFLGKAIDSNLKTEEDINSFLQEHCL